MATKHPPEVSVTAELRAQVARLKAANAAKDAALRAVEWSYLIIERVEDTVVGPMPRVVEHCPWCVVSRSAGHSSDCIVRAALSDTGEGCSKCAALIAALRKVEWSGHSRVMECPFCAAPFATQQHKPDCGWVAALSDGGEGKSKACPSCCCVLGTNTHCGTCKLNRGGEGWPGVREQARLAIGHAFHLIEHNKAMCVRCREAKQRLSAALVALKGEWRWPR